MIAASHGTVIKTQIARAGAYGSVLLFSIVLTAILAAEGIGLKAGWFAFAVSTILCAVAAWRGHLLIWTTLCISPLALISLSWLDLGADDIGRRSTYIFIFIGVSLVTAITGIVALRPRAARQGRQISTKGHSPA